MLGLGFSSGLPFLLVYGTQSAWLSEAHVPLHILSLLSEMTLAYKFKFLWAPFLDRYDPPLLGHLLGRRRGWIVAAQLGIGAPWPASPWAIPRTACGGRCCSRWPSASRARPRMW